MKRGAEQAEQQVIAAGLFAVLPWCFLADDQVAGKSLAVGCGCGESAVVGLDSAAGDQRGCATFEGFGNQVFELPSLVSTARKAGTIVAFDPEGGAAQGLGEAGEGLYWRGKVRIGAMPEVTESHGYNPKSAEMASSVPRNPARTAVPLCSMTGRLMSMGSAAMAVAHWVSVQLFFSSPRAR